MDKTDDILRPLLAEEAELIRRLEASPVYRKLKAVQAVISLYGRKKEAVVVAQAEKPQTGAPATSQPEPPPPLPPVAHSPDDVVDLAVDYVSGRGGYVAIMDIYNEMVRLGVEIKGKVPRNTLSARLSNSGRFIADRRLGWKVRNAPASASAPKSEATDDLRSSVASNEPGLSNRGIGSH